MSMAEYKFLLNSYKGMFMMMKHSLKPNSRDQSAFDDNDSESIFIQARGDLKEASKMLKDIDKDPVQFSQQLMLNAKIQYTAMLGSIKALRYLKEGNLLKSMKQLMKDMDKSNSY